MAVTLTAAQWRRINAVFDAVVDLPPGERAAILALQAGDDPAVLAEVQALLKAHGASNSFLAKPIAHIAPSSRLSRLSGALKANRTFKPGDVVGGDFEIVRLIGEGAFAQVYLASQRSLGRPVALKVTANVGREARTMAGLEHDHIVQVHSETVDAVANTRIICMQFVAGTTLQHLIEALGRLPPDARSGAAMLQIIDDADASSTLFNVAAVRDRESLYRMDFHAACLWIGVRLAEALAFAHARGILHLDVKPANILLNRYGRPMLTDFNVSLSPEDLASRDAAHLGGTISYMSPEHHHAFTTADPAAIASIDARSDLYSLGIVLTELLTCRRIDKTVDEASGSTLLAHTEALPEEIASVLHKAVKLQARDRFSDAGELANALENCREMALVRRSVPVTGRLNEFSHKHPIVAIVALAALPQLLGSIVNITYNSVRIVQELTPPQQRLFRDLILPYNAVFYPIGIWLVWRQVAFLLKSLRTRHDRVMPDPDTMAALRKRVLSTPYALVLAASIGWLPGAYLFPAMIDWLEGPVSVRVYVHFLVSFVSSWLIALTYSFLLLESVTLLVLYPRFWTGCCNIREASRFELRRVHRRLRLFQVLAGLIPLAGAMMIVGAGPDIADPEGYYVFQVMVVGLISLGMTGFVFAMKTSENIKRTVNAFTA